MNKVFKLIITAAAVIPLFTTPVLAAPVNMSLTYDGKTREYNAESISLLVNGKAVELAEMPPVILEGRTYVPSREVFEPLGAVVDWKDASRELYIGYNGTLVILKPGDSAADVNGETVVMESPAKIINNKLMIPARFVAENLGVPVSWDPETRTVAIGGDAAPADETQLYAPQSTPDTQTEQSGQIQTPDAPADGAASGISVDISPQPLSEIAGGNVDVTGVKAEGTVFTVSASGPVTKVEKLVLPENKLVLDIYNASNALSQSTHDSGGFAGVAAVRNSQFQVEPVKITRIVFDLVGSNRFSVSFGEERKNITVKFEENTISDVSFKKQDVGEQITVIGTLAPKLEAYRMFDPERLVFDIAGGSYAAGLTETTVNGSFAQSIRVSQFDARTVRIVVDLKESPQFSVSYEGNAAKITLSPPTYRGISYSQQPEPVITLASGKLSPADITHTDNYLKGCYILTLPGDFSSDFGSGEYVINDSLLESVEIRDNGGRTEIVLKQKSILAYTLSSDGEKLLIKPMNPKKAYKNVVYVDAGHGLNDPGAERHGFQEKNLNLSIVQMLYELLEADPDIKAYASRLDDSYPQNIDRALTANGIADLFVSVHHNAADSSKSNGTEVLYLNHEGEVYPNLTSEAAARIFQTNLVRDIGTTDRGVVKRPNLIVLNQTKIPAVLVEVIFMTNQDDINKVNTPEGRRKVAESLYRSIKEVFGQYPTGR